MSNLIPALFVIMFIATCCVWALRTKAKPADPCRAQKLRPTPRTLDDLLRDWPKP